MDVPRPTTLTLRARAKANLFLRILGTRPDGYHNLATVFQTLDLADTLEFRPAPATDDLQLLSTDPSLPLGPDNLIHKAWRLLLDTCREHIPAPGIICRIDKQIPMQAGLGGGSADAAATLVALNRLWQLDLDSTDLRTLAFTLGSDVPFPLLGATAFGTGRGEQLVSLPPIPQTYLLMAIPPVGVSTKAAFGWWDAAHPTTVELPDPAELRELWETVIHSGDWAQYVHNDFESVICDRVPQIAAVRDALCNRGIPTVMTGSGSTILGICTSYEHAATLAQGWQPVAGERLVITSTLNSSGIQ